MKNLYYFFLILCLVSFIDNDLNGQAVECPEDMVHYWSFDEKMNNKFADAIGNAPIDVLVPAIAVEGIMDSAQSFDGTSELRIVNDQNFDWEANSSFTIEFWMNKATTCPSNSASNNNVILGRDDPASNLHWWVGVSCINPGKIAFIQYSISGAKLELHSKKTVIDGNWHHIVVTRDGVNSITNLFIDGVKDTSGTFVFTDGFGSTVPVTLGWINTGGKYHYKGMLDELALYDSKIADALITNHYNNGLGSNYCEDEDVISGNPKPGEESYEFMVYPTWVSSDLHVKFTLAETQNVRITVYDLTGKRVKELYNNTLNSGDQIITFNSLKEILNQPEGAFLLIQLKLKDEAVTRKIILGN